MKSCNLTQIKTYFKTVILAIAKISCVIILSLSFVIFLAPIKTYAHIGGGPPFLKVNGKYAQTNPYYQGSTTLNIPQDFPPDSYVINKPKPVLFEVDTDQLTKQTTIPPEYAKRLTFRWSFAQGDNFENVDKNFQYGEKISHTFQKPQSYLIILEAKLPTDPDYITIDTAQINIVSSLSIHPPKNEVFIGTQNKDSQKNVLLVSAPHLDSSASVKHFIWDFNTGILYNGKSINRDFNNVNQYGIGIIYSRVIDSNGLTSDIGFNVENINNKLVFAPFGNMKTVPISFGTYEQAVMLLKGKGIDSNNSRPISVFLIGSIVTGIVVAIGVVVYLLNKPKP